MWEVGKKPESNIILFNKYIFKYQSKEDKWEKDTLDWNILVFQLLDMYFSDKSLKNLILFN